MPENNFLCVTSRAAALGPAKLRSLVCQRCDPGRYDIRHWRIRDWAVKYWYLTSADQDAVVARGSMSEEELAKIQAACSDAELQAALAASRAAMEANRLNA